MNVHRRTFLKRLSFGAAGLGLASAFPGCATAPWIDGAHLPRSTPEEQGVSSQAILDFLAAAADSKYEFHSFMMVRHGRVIAEGWWNPYRAAAKHSLYSLSKSFTSTAVGFAVTEGKLDVEAPVTLFFPNDVPADLSGRPHLRELRVKHLLTMSVGQGTDSVPLVRDHENWVREFLSLPIEHPPGSTFLYNSGASYMLSAIVQKVSGEKVIDYLRPRLFSPLRIHGMTWETCPRGINTGGWGLSLPTEALAKFGQFYLQNGGWNGRQILPQAWIREATTFKIQQPAGKGADLEKVKLGSDWHQGYCYQFWRCRHNAFRGDGAFGQFMIVMPGQEVVVAITCQTAAMQNELNLVWDHLLPGIQDTALPRDEISHKRLRQKLARLALPVPRGQRSSPLANDISGKTYALAPNDLGARSLTFRFPQTPPIVAVNASVNQNNFSFEFPPQDNCAFGLTDAKGAHLVLCGLPQYVDGICDVPGTPPKITVGNLSPCKISAGGAWKDNNTFEMIWRYYETPHHDTVTCHFDGNNVTLEFANSIPGHKETRPVLHGQK